MKHINISALGAAVALTCLVSAPAQAVTITVHASSAPNFFGSPSFAGWASNTQCFLQGTCAEGDRNITPEAFETLSMFTPGDAMVTSFNSWRGQADPGTTFSTAFANELGNRIHFPVSFISNDADDTFTLADISFEISSPDGGSSGFGGSGLLGFDGDLSGTTLNGTSRIGVHWGPDGAPGGGDDIIFTGGEDDTTLLHELYYIGVGNALWPQVPDHGDTEQEALDNVAALFRTEGITSITGEYRIGNDIGSTSVSLVPIPAALPLLATALGGLGLLAWRRRKSV